MSKYAGLQEQYAGLQEQLDQHLCNANHTAADFSERLNKAFESLRALEKKLAIPDGLEWRLNMLTQRVKELEEKGGTVKTTVSVPGYITVPGSKFFTQGGPDAFQVKAIPYNPRLEALTIYQFPDFKSAIEMADRLNRAEKG